MRLGATLTIRADCLYGSVKSVTTVTNPCEYMTSSIPTHVTNLFCTKLTAWLKGLSQASSPSLFSWAAS